MKNQLRLTYYMILLDILLHFSYIEFFLNQLQIPLFDPNQSI